MEAPYLDSLGSYVGQLGTGLYKRFLDTVLNRGEDEGNASLYHELTSVPRHKAKTNRIGEEHMNYLKEHHSKLPNARLSSRSIGKRDLDRLNKDGPYGFNKSKTMPLIPQEPDEDLMFLATIKKGKSGRSRRGWWGGGNDRNYSTISLYRSL
jgi:hypothetical protein